jgi:hypothetical protein
MMNGPTSSSLTVVFFVISLLSFRLEADSWVRRIEAQAPVLGVGLAPMGRSFVVGWSADGAALTLFDEGGSASASVRLAETGIIRSMSTAEDGTVLVAGQVPTGAHVNGSQVMTFQGVVHTVASNGRVSRSTHIGTIDSTGSGESLVRTAIGACRSGRHTYVVGTHGRDAAMTARLTPGGHIDWIHVDDLPLVDELAAVVCTDDGGAVAAGMVGGPMPVIQRVDSEGRLIWRAVFGSIRGRFLSLRPDGRGSIIAAGVAGQPGLDMIVATIGLDGTPGWVRQVGSPRNEIAVSAHVTSRSTIAVGGFVYGDSTVSPVATELRLDGTFVRSEEIPAARTPISNVVAASPDAAGELAFAVASGRNVVVTRWDGSAARSCGSDSGMTVSHLTPSLTTVSPASPEHNTNNTEWLETSPREIEIKVSRVTCDDTSPVPREQAAADEPTISRMAQQAMEKARFKDEVWKLFMAKRWDELEAMAVALRSKNETWPNGDWKLYEFYNLLGHIADGSPAIGLRTEWLAARPTHTAAKIAMAEAHLDRYWGRWDDGDFSIARAQLATLPDDLRDPELAALRVIEARFAGDDWWRVFDQGVIDFPGYYMLYSQATLASLKDIDRLGRVIEHARRTGRAMGWGDSLVARVINIASLYVDARDWPISWREVQKAYLDLFKVYPESYKNMFRYGMVACDVKDRVVAANVFANPDLDAPHDIAEWSGRTGQERVQDCRSWATMAPAGSWAKPAAPGEDGLSRAEFLRTAALPSDPVLADYAGRMLDLVDPQVSGWPKLIVDSSDDVIQGAEAGFFARASNTMMCFVTASASGSAPALRVRQNDGTFAPQSPLPTEDGGDWKTAVYRADEARLVELKLSGVRPRALMSVLTVSPGESGQIVSRGLIYRAEGETPQSAAPGFGVIMQPGSPLPPAGSPVLYDSAHLAGIVVTSSVVDGWVVVECETAERVLRNLPNRWKLEKR